MLKADDASNKCHTPSTVYESLVCLFVYIVKNENLFSLKNYIYYRTSIMYERIAASLSLSVALRTANVVKFIAAAPFMAVNPTK